LRKLDKNLDVKGFDMPRNDIRNVKLKNNKTIRVGGDNPSNTIKYFRKYILPYINKAFTEKELKGIELYIEYPGTSLQKHFLGMQEGWLSDKNQKFSTIELTHIKDGLSAVHEILHAVRYKNNRRLKNLNDDEAETDLEAMMRYPPRALSKIPCNDGYYDFVKGNKCKARKEDAKIIKDNCNLRDKAGLSKCIRKNLKKTHIGKIKVPKKYHP
jgi:hypothetical protein